MSGVIAPFFVELSVVIIVATLMGILFRILKQPLMLAYIATGILLGASFFNVLQSHEVIDTFSQIGVAFLLYLVGLNLDIRQLKDVGRISIVTGLAQVVFTTVVGYFLAQALGFDAIASIYIAMALAFSSTIIIVKLLSDKNDLNSLYGRISLGILLVQDFVAILALIFVSGIGSQLSIEGLLANLVIKGGLLFAFAYVVTHYLLQPVFYRLAHNRELLFLSGISWCFFLAMASDYVGMSLEIGAFVAGVSLASMPYSFEIGGRIRSLRDFFLVLFFVTLGSSMVFASDDVILFPAVVFTAFVLLVQPLLIMAVMGVQGYRKRTSFLAALSGTQISEFSLILVALGVSVGHLQQDVATLVTVVGVVTIAVSSLLIQYSNRVYAVVGRFVPSFERKTGLQEEGLDRVQQDSYDVVLVGANKIGRNVLNHLVGRGKSVLVVEFDPTLLRLLREKAHCLFGDMADPEVLDRMVSVKPKAVVSTVHDLEDNLVLVKKLKSSAQPPIVFVTSLELPGALRLYEAGADFVLVPHLAGGEKISRIVTEHVDAEGDLPKLRAENLELVRQLLKAHIR